MNGPIALTRRMNWGILIASVALTGGTAWAQAPDKKDDAAKTAPEATGTVVAQAEAAPPPPPPTPPPPAPQPAAPPVAAVPAAADTTAATVTATPAAPAPDYKKINVGVAMRVGGVLQSGTNPSSLSDASVDQIYVEPRFSGDIAPMFAWQANFQGAIPTGAPMGMSTAGGNGSGTLGVSASILDLIAKFEPHPTFHLWAGRMLVSSDRSNFSGPWFMSPWKYPGLYPGLPFPVGPKQGPQGRNNGATVWGELLGAKLKYYAGVFDLNDVGQSPLFTGRVNICLLGSESGFYHSSTYYGSQDIVAIGLGGQYQKNAQMSPTGPADLTTFLADVLAEKNLGTGGVVTGEGQYYLFDQNDIFGRKHAYYVLASWLTPQKLGVGKLQPLVRWQQATAQASGLPSFKMIDAYVTYVIDDYFLRAALGFSHAEDVLGVASSNAVYLGIQMQR